jgi:hypothetical protein
MHAAPRASAEQPRITFALRHALASALHSSLMQKWHFPLPTQASPCPALLTTQHAVTDLPTQSLHHAQLCWPQASTFNVAPLSRNKAEEQIRSSALVE